MKSHCLSSFNKNSHIVNIEKLKSPLVKQYKSSTNFVAVSLLLLSAIKAINLGMANYTHFKHCKLGFFVVFFNKKAL
jgi:hypothetical protein